MPSPSQPSAQPVIPPLEPTVETRLRLTYYTSRIQYPGIDVPWENYRQHILRAMSIYLPKAEGPVDWPSFLAGLYAFDWTVCCGCVEGSDRAWDTLFATRTGRSDCLLVDALRSRACRLFPRDEERQESAVTEFWSHLLVPDTDHGLSVLKRYDGQRPLAPWLIRVFQNWHLSKLRRQNGLQALPDDDIALPAQTDTKTETRWHEAFRVAAHAWLEELPDNERLLLGLRWRYRLSQREVANLLGVHEGTISRQTDKLRDHALEQIAETLIAEGWTGDDLQQYFLSEMASLLIDNPRLSAEQLNHLLRAQGKQPIGE